MKKLIVTLLIVLGFTITSVYADYTQPTNLYEHTFTTAEETHIIQKGSDFFYPKLSVADVYYNGELVVSNGTLVNNSYEWTHYPSENHYVLFNGSWEALVVIFYDLGNYVDVSLNIDVELAAGAMYKPLAGIYTIGVEVEATEPIRPQLTLGTVTDNIFDVEVTNYNDYEVLFFADIYDSDGVLLEPSAFSSQLAPNETKTIDANFLDWWTEEAFLHETEYKVDGYFVKAFSAAGYSPSKKSDRITVITGILQEYDVNLTFNTAHGDVTGPTTAYPRDMLTFEANPFATYQLKGWNVTIAGTTTFYDSTHNPFYLEMPYGDIEVQAIFSQRLYESGYKTFSYNITQSQRRYVTNEPEFFTRGRVGAAIIYLDGVKIVDKGQIVNEDLWLQYYDNPYMENVYELLEIGAGGILTISYGDGYNYSTDLKQGDVVSWLSAGSMTGDFQLEILLPLTDPNPSVSDLTEPEPNVPINIQAALELFGANNVYGYIIIFVSSVLIVNIALMSINANTITYVIINLTTAIVYITAGMLPLWASVIWVSFIFIAFIASIKGGEVSE